MLFDAFVQMEHIHLVEVMAAISVVKRLYREKWRNVMILLGLDSRAAVGGLGKELAAESASQADVWLELGWRRLSRLPVAADLGQPGRCTKSVRQTP